MPEGRVGTVWEVEEVDVRPARSLAERPPAPGARDLLHLASCRRRDQTRAETFHRTQASVFS